MRAIDRDERRQHVGGIHRLAELAAERLDRHLGLVARAVEQPVDPALQPRAERRERQRAERRRRRPQGALRPHSRARRRRAPGRHTRRRDDGAEQAVGERPVEHEVDVVEPVADEASTVSRLTSSSRGPTGAWPARSHRCRCAPRGAPASCAPRAGGLRAGRSHPVSQRAFGPGARSPEATVRVPRAALSWDVRADVAQLVEHFTRNEGVRGSNPRVGFPATELTYRFFAGSL